MSKSRFLVVVVSVLMLGLGVDAACAGLTLVGHYTFEDGAELGKDSSGWGNDGVAAPSLTQVAGAYAGSNAASFNGSSGKIVISPLSGYDGLPGLTFAAWVNQASSASGYDGILSQDAGSCCENRLLISSSNHPYINVHQHADKHLTATTLPRDQWYHIVLTGKKEGGQGVGRVYVNGSEVSQSPQYFNLLGSSAPFTTYLGTGEAGTAHLLTGLLDEVQIYDGALQGWQVAYLYNNPGAVSPIPEPSALAIWGLGLVGVGLCAWRRRRGLKTPLR